MLFKEVRVLAKGFMFCLSNVTFMSANNYIVRFHFDSGTAMKQEVSARDCNSIIAIEIDGRVAKNPFLKDSSYVTKKDSNGNALIDPDIRDWIKSIFFNSASANVSKMEGMPIKGGTFQGSTEVSNGVGTEPGASVFSSFGGNPSGGSFYRGNGARKKQEAPPPIFPFLAETDSTMEDAEYSYGDFAGRR